MLFTRVITLTARPGSTRRSANTPPSTECSQWTGLPHRTGVRTGLRAGTAQIYETRFANIPSSLAEDRQALFAHFYTSPVK